MKTTLVILIFTLSCTLSLPNVCPTGGPEIYTRIIDNENVNYKITAVKWGNAPIYGQNLEFTNEFDTAEDEFQVQSGIPTACEGFDWVEDWQALDNTNNDDLGYGYYKISVIRDYKGSNQQTILSFYIDLRMDPQDVIGSPDVTINLVRNTNGSFDFEYSCWTSDGTKHFNPLNWFDTILIWENNREQERDWSVFEKYVELTNDVDGSTIPNQNIQLLTAEYGFPEADENNYEGKEFSTGSDITLWHSVNYKFGVNENVISYNGNSYKIRHWNSSENTGATRNILISNSPSFTQIKAYYEPVQIVSIINNLEDGTSTDQYRVTWQPDRTTDYIDFGVGYNAFLHSYNLDKYSFQALPITSQRYNTTWTFFNWNNGSNTSTISDIRIPDDIPTVGSFIANYKGHLRFNNFDSFNTSGQRHLVRDADGYYHLFYISLDDILWYTKSLNTNFNGTWSTEYDLLPEVKNVSAYIDDNKIYLVLEMKSETNCLIHCWILAAEDGDLLDYFDVANITPSYWGNAHPTVAATENERMFVYRKSSTGGLYYKRWWFNGHIWYEYPETYISNSSFSSLNPSLYMQKNDPANIFHLAYEDGIELTSIKYVYTSGGTFGTPRNISDASGYNFNTNPSLSLFKKDLSTYQPIVSWLGSNGGGLEKGEGISIPTPRLIVRACDNFLAGTWGSTNVYGEEVSSTQNNSVIGLLNQSIITWGQKDGTESKWVKRDGTTYYGPYCMYPAGHNTNISNGTSFSNLKALTFNKESLPYIISPNTIGFAGTPNCGGEEKVVTAYPFTFSRAGVILKKGVEFAYHTGDVVVDDSAIQFIEVPDTLSFGNSVELNQILRTMDFPLNSNSSLIFSNYYYVLNKEMADSLSAEDAVSYRVELVNSTSGSIAGTFDNITYNKNNLEDYENISYQIDCSGITEGNYYFRLVTAVTGDAEYNLINAVNDAGTVAKRSFDKISFTGDKLPVTYDLSQNYPNPFNPATIINYQLPQNGHVTLKVYDILGKEVTTLVNEQKVEGRYSVNFNASHLASGVYIYQLRVNDYASSKKMLLLK